MLALGLDYLKLANLEMSKFGTNHELSLFKLQLQSVSFVSYTSTAAQMIVLKIRL